MVSNLLGFALKKIYSKEKKKQRAYTLYLPINHSDIHSLFKISNTVTIFKNVFFKGFKFLFGFKYFLKPQEDYFLQALF